MLVLINRIKQMIDGLLDYIQYDFESVPETQTFLYHILWGVKNGNFDFYEQAKDIFLRKAISPRKIYTTMEYPKDKSHLPCIVVRESSKNSQTSPIGGFGMANVDEFGVPEYAREGFRMPIEYRIELMCFSDNSLESILISEVLYALFVGARNTFEQEFSSFDFNCSELIAENSVFPQPLLIKNIVLELQDVPRYPSIIRPEIIKKFCFERPIPVGSDPNYVEPEEPTNLYFEFGYPYVWLDDETLKGEQLIFSNTDWQLYLNNDDKFKFGSPYVWLDNEDKGEQNIEAKVPWKLE